MSQQKYFHFTVEGSRTEIIAAIDENKVTTVISYKNGFRNEDSHDFEERKQKGYDKGVLKHHEFTMADALIPHMIRFGKDIDKIEPHDLLTIIEYRTKIKEKEKKEEIEYNKGEALAIGQVENEYVENLIQSEIESHEQEILDIEDMELTEIEAEAEFFQDLNVQMVVDGELTELERKESNDEIVIESSNDVVILPEFYFFSKAKHCFHPSYPAVFIFREKTFISVNQFIAYSKAIIAKDDVAAFKIMEYNRSNTTAVGLIEKRINGQEIIKEDLLYNKWKRIDHEINELNKEIKDNLMIWEEKRMGVMTVATREKCKQNEDIQKTLVDTKEQKIVFAIQNSILGAGIKESEIDQNSVWCGVNELGKIFDSLK